MKTCDKLVTNPEFRTFKNYLTNLNESLFLLFLSNQSDRINGGISTLFRISKGLILLIKKYYLFGFYHLYRYVLKSEVHMVHIQLVFGPTCAEPIYVDWRRYRVVNSLLCRDNPLCVLIIPRNMSTQRFSSRLELISRMLDIFETDLIQVPFNSKCLTLTDHPY